MREVVLVYLSDEDVIGHIESDHGSWAVVVYSKRGIKYTVNVASEDYIVMETIQVDDDESSDDEEDIL